jgi:2-octaprenyl-6-methoxyphenol hydroxylase
VLEAYTQARRFDTVMMGAVTDGLNRLFATDSTPVRMLRDLGLGVVDRLPGLKSRLIREAAALSGGMPRLLRGEIL